MVHNFTKLDLAYRYHVRVIDKLDGAEDLIRLKLSQLEKTSVRQNYQLYTVVI